MIERNMCAKCGSGNITTIYHQSYKDCGRLDRAKMAEEHLHYRCVNCFFDWSRPTLDNREEESDA